MRKRRRGLASVAMAGFLTGCTVFGVRDAYEAPGYQVIETLADNFEIRRYGARFAAETDYDGDQSFRRLFNYISGGNQGETKVSMTVPVETAKPAQIAMTVPVETAPESHMRFFLPKSFTAETAPVPADPRVRIVEVPEQTLAVLRYSGFGFEESVEARKTELMNRLGKTAWEPVSDPIAYFYDPPWAIPFFRRNEVLVEVKKRAG